MNDIPYLRPQHLSPETVAVMTRVCSKVREILPEKTPAGVQVLSLHLKSSNSALINSPSKTFTPNPVDVPDTGRG